MIKNKKIMFICKESYSFPLYFVAKKLLSENNDIAVFFVHPEEGLYNKCMYNEHTFYYYKNNLKNVRIYDLRDLCKKFDNKYTDSIIDLNYLSFVEKEYCNFNNLNLQLTASQLTTRHYHTRFYFNYSTFQQSLSFIELGYKRVIEILDEFNPDVIMDTEDGELLRTILNEVAYKKGIPYVNIDYPRYEAYKIPTYCLGLNTEKYFINEYYRNYLLPIESLRQEYDYVLNFRASSGIMSKEFAGTTTSQYQADSVYYAFKKLIGMSLYFWNLAVSFGNWRLMKRKQILYSNPLKHFLFYVMVAIKRQLLFRNNRYFEAPEKDDTYVYLPLHLIPESTTFVKAPFYIDELNIIAQVSKSLPIGWKLYVKEHQAMLGERSLSFYRAVKKIPNVKLVKFNYYDDPKPWILNSRGVITIAGTGAYEAAMLGKKSIVFADVPFTLIEGVSRVRSFQELPRLIADFGSIENIQSCAAYIAATKSTGKEINLKYLIAEGEAIIRGEEEITTEFQGQIDTLVDFFIEAYEKYPSRASHK